MCILSKYYDFISLALFTYKISFQLSHLDGEASERVICATCVSRLREASAFRRQVLSCEEKLLSTKIRVHCECKIYV